MPSTYSSLLRLELMATGEKSATWGDITNTNLGTLLEKSIAGSASINVTAGNVTLTALNGSDDEARCMTLLVTGTPGVSRNIVAPSASKTYCVINGSNAAVVVKGAATSGVSLVAGERAWVTWNGSDFVRIGIATDSPTFTGTTTVAALTASGNVTLGDAVADTLSVGGSTVKNGSGNWSLPAPSSGSTLSLASVAGAVGLSVSSAAASDAQISMAAISYARDWRLKAVNSDGSFRLADQTAGFDRLLVDINGNFGFSMVPTYKVDVTGSAGNGYRYVGPTAQVLLGEVGSIGAVGTLTNHALQFITNSVERTRWTAGGILIHGRTTDSGFGAFQVQSGGSQIADFIGTGNSYVNLRAPAGSIGGLRIAGNGLTLGTTSFDLQQDSAGAVDLVNRSNTRLSLYTNGTEYLRITNVGQVQFQGIHNNASGASGTTPMIASGTYTPTITNVSHLASSTASACQWIRVGNVVTVSGTVTLAGDSNSTLTEARVSLPIASALSASNHLGGGGAEILAAGMLALGICARATSDDADFFFTPLDTSSHTFGFSFTYVVL